jgi:hypothetical protein
VIDPQSTTHLRTAAAVAVGAFAAVLLGYLAVVIFVLATIGIPLGARPEPLRVIQYAVLIVLAGGATAVGRASCRTCGGGRESRKYFASTSPHTELNNITPVLALNAHTRALSM